MRLVSGLRGGREPSAGPGRVEERVAGPLQDSQSVHTGRRDQRGTSGQCSEHIARNCCCMRVIFVICVEFIGIQQMEVKWPKRCVPRQFFAINNGLGHVFLVCFLVAS